ncbi:LytTR family DNA-binding domain-containing protein [Anaerosporobacter faecicola]|uniref:LytTR family DNA-binding domain-containing protein n=1 Tax=Anaerosporobacter faecicola TaxID=2718714 RepID=UPI00143AB156|nr:LytTR family DNA-binding domain-containing protein [Anaerosporobacter faecicola]
MKINLYENKELTEDYVDVHYHEMTEELRHLCSLFGTKKLELYGTDQEEKQLLRISDIFYFESVEKRTYAYLAKKVYQVSYRLGELEEALKDQGFIRINKSVVVNIYKIKKIRSEINMRVQAQLQNQEEIVISRHYKSSFEKYLVRMRGVIHEEH